LAGYGLKKRKLLAIDPSLTASGWALFDATRQEPVALGLICPPGPGTALALRLTLLQQEVEELIAELLLVPGDILVCEGPAPIVLNPDSAIKVERVRGIFESAARSAGLIVPGRINPRTVQAELMGMRGRQLARREVKEAARATAAVLFGSGLTELPTRGKWKKNKKGLPQDIIDALLIGAVAVSRVNLASNSGAALEQVFGAPERKLRNSRNPLRANRWSAEDIDKLRANR